MMTLLTTGCLHAPEPSQDRFVDVQQITFLKKGEPKESRIVISDPARIKQLLDVLHLEKSERPACDMSWDVDFIKTSGRIDTHVCTGCVEIYDATGVNVSRRRLNSINWCSTSRNGNDPRPAFLPESVFLQADAASCMILTRVSSTSCATPFS